MMTIKILAVAGAFLASAACFAQAQRSELRVCADPSNLPYSAQDQTGFENKIASLLADDMHLHVTYTWFPQVTGFVRNTLGAQKCDLVMGTVSGEDMMANTTAYYHTGYMIVTRTADKITATSLGDPIFKDKKIGLIARTPPVDQVVKHDLTRQVVPYDLVTDTRVVQAPRELLKDLAKGEVDVALVWGPQAGYFIKQDKLPLTAAFLTQEEGGARLDYHIAMGVRATDTEWRRQISDEIVKNKDKIQAILEEYGVPLMDEQNKPLKIKG
jgi:quinoprotein dehydrogenase-associated probable ABC transporter substrate-binding protein